MVVIINHGNHLHLVVLCVLSMLPNSKKKKERKREKQRKEKRATRDINSEAATILQWGMCSSTDIPSRYTSLTTTTSASVSRFKIHRACVHSARQNMAGRSSQREKRKFGSCCFDPWHVVWRVGALPEAGRTVRGAWLATIGPSSFNHNI